MNCMLIPTYDKTICVCIIYRVDKKFKGLKTKEEEEIHEMPLK